MPQWLKRQYRETIIFKLPLAVWADLQTKTYNCFPIFFDDQFHWILLGFQSVRMIKKIYIVILCHFKPYFESFFIFTIKLYIMLCSCFSSSSLPISPKSSKPSSSFSSSLPASPRASPSKDETVVGYIIRIHYFPLMLYINIVPDSLQKAILKYYLPLLLSKISIQTIYFVFQKAFLLQWLL